MVDHPTNVVSNRFEGLLPLDKHWQSCNSSVQLNTTHLHCQEHADVVFVCETTDHGQAAHTEVEQLNAEIRQQETGTNLISRDQINVSFMTCYISSIGLD